MFSLSRYAQWARNIALIASNNKHRWNLNQFKTGVIAAVSVSPPPAVCRSFAGEYGTESMGQVDCKLHSGCVSQGTSL